MVKMPHPSAAALRHAARAELRRTAGERRNAQDQTTIAAWSAALRKQLLARWPTPPGRVIGFCWPIANEPDLRPLLETWGERAPIVAALPVVVAPKHPLDFRPWHPGAAMVTDRYGIPTPTEGASVRPEVLLIPLNAFDGAGYRIGYGGGYFDRTLAALKPRPLAIGVGFELGRVASIQPEPHDQRLDWIVTEAGSWSF